MGTIIDLLSLFHSEALTIESCILLGLSSTYVLLILFKKNKKNPATNPEETRILNEKIKELEEKLFEYSVLEKDLWDLKRLKEENTSLKSKNPSF